MDHRQRVICKPATSINAARITYKQERKKSETDGEQLILCGRLLKATPYMQK